MVAGQNKGLALVDLMQHMQITYDRVVLVDDGEKHINDVRDAMTAAGIEYRGVRYNRIDKGVDASREQQGIEGWRAWQELLSRTYPERLKRMNAGECAY
jgi:hypothetical protein